MARYRNITGIERVQKAMANYTQEAREELVVALNRSAEEVHRDAVQLAPGPEAPYGTGELKSAIEIKQSLEGFNATGAVGNFATGDPRPETGLDRYIGVFPEYRGAPGWYAAFVEFGTSPRSTGESYATRSGRNRKTSGPAGGAIGDYHPGTKPQPFMFPAWNANRQAIISRLKRAATKAAKKSLG